jgi:hypothetical protein
MASSNHAASNESSLRVANDPRADHGTRQISIAANMIHIERVLNGVKMRVRIPSHIYEGVTLLAREEPEGNIYEIALAHRDPDLSVSLDTLKDKDAATDLQQQWAQFFVRPVLDKGIAQAETTDPTSISAPRRRCMTHVAKRRPRLLARRKNRNLENLEIVWRDEREIICYE